MSTESWFFIIIGLVIFNYLFSNILDYLNHKNWKDDIPNELKGFYKKEKYLPQITTLLENNIGRNKFILNVSVKSSTQTQPQTTGLNKNYTFDTLLQESPTK